MFIEDAVLKDEELPEAMKKYLEDLKTRSEFGKKLVAQLTNKESILAGQARHEVLKIQPGYVEGFSRLDKKAVKILFPKKKASWQRVLQIIWSWVCRQVRPDQQKESECD